jgi:hypothetical protein
VTGVSIATSVSAAIASAIVISGIILPSASAVRGGMTTPGITAIAGACAAYTRLGAGVCVGSTSATTRTRTIAVPARVHLAGTVFSQLIVGPHINQLPQIACLHHMSAFYPWRTWALALRMPASDPKRTLTERRLQFGLPDACFHNLITPGGNSRCPTPVRRQASGHISSK